MQGYINAIKEYKEIINKEIDNLLAVMQHIACNDDMKISIESYLLDLDDLEIETTHFKSVLVSDAVTECEK